MRKILTVAVLLLAWGSDYLRGMHEHSAWDYLRWREYRPSMGILQDEVALDGAKRPADPAGQEGRRS